MPDGKSYSAPSQDGLPVALSLVELAAGVQQITIHLALPLMNELDGHSGSGDNAAQSTRFAQVNRPAPPPYRYHGGRAVVSASIQTFFDTTERGAAKLDIASEDMYAAKYAFCAAIDEAILSQPSNLREGWERNPLQLRLFGEHLAGEHFFDRLEQLRAQGGPRLASLEVYHYCLLLGFEGKYRLEGPEKLGYLTARLGDEIVYLKGKRAGFAPHWAPPDKVVHALRRVTPLWLPAIVVAGIGILGYLGLQTYLGRQTDQRLAAYNDVIQMPQRTAHVTITLP